MGKSKYILTKRKEGKKKRMKKERKQTRNKVTDEKKERKSRTLEGSKMNEKKE